MRIPFLRSVETGGLSVRRDLRPSPVELLLRERLRGTMHRSDVPIVLAHLGDPVRWDPDACRRISEEMAARSAARSAFNEAFVSARIADVGSDVASGLRARQRWIATPLDRFTAAIEEAYSRREFDLTSTRRAYLRALFVSCLMHANVGPVHSAANAALKDLSRRSGPTGP